MWYIVDSKNNVTPIKPKAQTINVTQYPKNIFTLWSADELKSIGVYRVVEEGSHGNTIKFINKTSNPQYYQDEDVVKIIKSCTAKTDIGPLQDTLLSRLQTTMSGTLSNTDWYIVREVEGYKDAIEPVKAFRKALRNWGDALTILVSDAETFTDLDALTDNTVDSDGKPVLAEFNKAPTLEAFIEAAEAKAAKEAEEAKAAEEADGGGD